MGLICSKTSMWLRVTWQDFKMIFILQENQKMDHDLRKTRLVQHLKINVIHYVNRESESHSVVSNTLWTHWILQARILKWVAFPFSGESSQPRYWTQVSHIAGGFFNSWDTREAQEYLSGYHISSSGDLPNPGIEPRSLTLWADSLLYEPWGEPKNTRVGSLSFI